MSTNFQGKKEYWWEFLREKVKEKYHNGEPLKTITGVKNKILEVGEDFFVVKSERGKKNRKITKERVERVLKIVVNKGFYDVIDKDMSKACLNLEDGSNLWGAHTSIIRGLLVELPFINRGERATKIIFLPEKYDKEKWGIDY